MHPTSARFSKVKLNKERQRERERCCKSFCNKKSNRKKISCNSFNLWPPAADLKWLQVEGAVCAQRSWAQIYKMTWSKPNGQSSRNQENDTNTEKMRLYIFIIIWSSSASGLCDQILTLFCGVILYCEKFWTNFCNFIW